MCPYLHLSPLLPLRVSSLPAPFTVSSFRCQVAWVRVDTQTILTIHRTVITRNPRVTLEHNGHTKWHLHISDVGEPDRGAYMCQINTDPMIFQTGFLQVVGESARAVAEASRGHARTLGGHSRH